MAAAQNLYNKKDAWKTDVNLLNVSAVNMLVRVYVGFLKIMLYLFTVIGGYVLREFLQLTQIKI